MRILILGVLAVLVACAPQQPSEGFKPATTPAYDAAPGVKYSMYSIVGIGDIALSADQITTSDGQVLPIQEVSDGVYVFLDPPSALTNGENFCFSKPVTFFTWHQHDEGLWVMNVGDWRTPPAVPVSSEWSAEGGCGGYTYNPA